MSKNIYQPLTYALLLMIGIQLGFKLDDILHKGKSPLEDFNSYKELSPTESVDEVFQYINAKYVDSLNTKELATDVIKNTLAELDPHSSYISRIELDAVKEDLEGEFDGIGIEFSLVNDSILVVTPLSGGPSESVGILPGDKIVSIDDSLVVGKKLNTDLVISLLRGKKGTEVDLGIKRANVKELLTFTVTRDIIPLTSVDIGYMVNDKTGYIKVNRFSATTYNEFGKELFELKEAGMQHLILDLRGNPGGYLDAAYKMLDELIPGKEILVYTEGSKQRRRNYISKISGLFETNNIAVLIDEGSASASEIMAGAIQDLDRGILVGRRTFGKGLVQEQIELSDGSAMRLTIARYYTPSGRCIQKPFEKGEKQAYNSEIVQRSENGELFNENVNEKLIKADTTDYFTRYGRKIFGGGGIQPDIHIPLDTSQTTGYYRLRSQLVGFVYDYFSKNQNSFMQYESFDEFDKNFSINNQILEQFKTYVIKGKVKFENNDIVDNKAEFSTYIKAYIARQRWGNEGFFPIYNQLDETLQKAIKEVEQLDMRTFIESELKIAGN